MHHSTATSQTRWASLQQPHRLDGSVYGTGQDEAVLPISYQRKLAKMLSFFYWTPNSTCEKIPLSRHFKFSLKRRKLRKNQSDFPEKPYRYLAEKQTVKQLIITVVIFGLITVSSGSYNEGKLYFFVLYLLPKVAV